MNVQAFWTRKTPLNFLLLPLSWVFGALVVLRRCLYRRGWLASAHPGVPVIIVGNLSAGGSGKTPFVIWLVQWLRHHGYRPGVVSKGYGRRDRKTRCVSGESLTDEVGDEPLLIHLKTGAPVAVGSDRLEAARLLLARNPGVDIVVSDDGLQHYRLRRNLELVMADAQTLFGNGWLLPAGPLREPVTRLNAVDAVILTERTGTANKLVLALPVFPIRYEPAGFRNVANGRRVSSLPHYAGREIEAVAGIARPKHFFGLLEKLGIRHRPRVFPDHHQFVASDLASGSVVVMTEKDAVKCRSFAGADWWALELELVQAPDLEKWLSDKIDKL